MYSYHRNPQYWKEPEKFQPDRFLTVKDAGDLPFAPFGDVSGSELVTCCRLPAAMLEALTATL